MENPDSENSIRVYGSPSQNAGQRFTGDPETATIPSELLRTSITYCQVRDLVMKEAFKPRQS